MRRRTARNQCGLVAESETLFSVNVRGEYVCENHYHIQQQFLCYSESEAFGLIKIIQNHCC